MRRLGGRTLVFHAGDTQIDQMGPIGCNDDVLGRDIAMDDAMAMQFRDCLAYTLDNGERLMAIEPAAFRHMLCKGAAGNVAAHDHESVGGLIRRLDMGQTRAGAFGKRRPNAAMRG